MAHYRSLSWSAALSDIRSDRIQLAPADRITRGRQRAFAKLAAQRASAMISVCPLVNAGAYDHRAIMCTAIVAAKARRSVTDEAWSVCIAAALAGTWHAAKAARLSTMSRQQGRFERARQPVHRDNFLTVRAAEGKGGLSKAVIPHQRNLYGPPIAQPR